MPADQMSDVEQRVPIEHMRHSPYPDSASEREIVLGLGFNIVYCLSTGNPHFSIHGHAAAQASHNPPIWLA